MIIQSYESGKRSESCIHYLRESGCADEYQSVILLPIPTTRDNCTILNTKIYINDVLDDIYGNVLVSGYGLSDIFIAAAEAKGASVVDLSRDEDFLLENADLTALCALGIFLSSSGCAPKDTCVGIVGYGRIGKRLTNLFLFLGARVRVFTSRENTCAHLGEYGVSCDMSSEDADLSGIDILFNTAPAVIFRHERIPEELRVIDLASGDNFPGVDVEKYPSVPAKMLPFSAGKAWGRAIERFIARRNA